MFADKGPVLLAQGHSGGLLWRAVRGALNPSDKYYHSCISGPPKPYSAGIKRHFWSLRRYSLAAIKIADKKSQRARRWSRGCCPVAVSRCLCR